MLIGKYFKNKREEKGLSQEQVASMIRPDFAVSLLWDFENFDDNDIDGWLVVDFKKYCEVLSIAPREYALIASKELSSLEIADLVKLRREEMGFSVLELAERIGYEDIVIINIESGKHLGVCLDVYSELSKHLILPFELLLSKI